MNEMLGDLRVWWIPQIPMKAFYVEVETPEEAKKVLDLLAKYDLFQYQEKVKGDYSNVGGLEEKTEDGWVEWESEEGDNIDDYKIDNVEAKE
jgi:hypothetical protein